MGPRILHSQNTVQKLLVLGPHFEPQRTAFALEVIARWPWRVGHEQGAGGGGEEAGSLGRDEGPTWEKEKANVW